MGRLFWGSGCCCCGGGGGGEGVTLVGRGSKTPALADDLEGLTLRLALQVQCTGMLLSLSWMSLEDEAVAWDKSNAPRSSNDAMYEFMTFTSVTLVPVCVTLISGLSRVSFVCSSLAIDSSDECTLMSSGSS